MCAPFPCGPSPILHCSPASVPRLHQLRSRLRLTHGFLQHVEVGYHHQLMHEYDIALNKYTEARDLDDLNMTPLYGTINCQLYTGQLDDAADQIEFLTEIASSTGKPGRQDSPLPLGLEGRHRNPLDAKWLDAIGNLLKLFSALCWYI